MRAASYSRTGSAADVLSIIELPRPEPGPGEVRVRMAWSAVNPSDVKSRAGTRSPTLPYPRVTPHSDGAGSIDAVGDGVAASRMGERVWLWNAAWGRADGTAAEWVVLPSAQAVRLPDTVPLDVGALLGIPALTAMHAVDVAGGVAGKRVLVAGGAGAVGRYAVQMARQAGASQVIATVSSPAKAALAQSAGADLAIDYRQVDPVGAVLAATDGRGVDRIIEVDFGSNVAQDFTMLASGGEIVVYGSTAPEIAVPFVPAIIKNVALHFFIVYNLSPADRASAVARLDALLEGGLLTHNIDSRFPLDAIAAAHERVESGKAIGSVLLQVS